MTYEIQRMIVVSTAHLSQETRDLLDSKVAERMGVTPDTGIDLPVTDPIGTYGWRVHVAERVEDMSDNWPTDLGEVLHFAHSCCCQWVAIDQDGPVMGHLTTYPDEEPTTTTQDAFHSLRGHVADGVQIAMNNGDTLTVKAVMGGWQLVDQNGRLVDVPTDSAHVLECLVYAYPNDIEGNPR